MVDVGAVFVVLVEFVVIVAVVPVGLVDFVRGLL